MAIFNQIFWNTIRGRWFEGTITLNNYLADHFSPALVLLLPLYAIKPSAITLLVIQVIFTSLCAWPLYKIVKKNSGSNIFAYLASFLWLSNPLVHRQVLYEFHMFHIMIFFFFWAFYFYQQKNTWSFVLFFLLTLATREDAALLFLSFGLFCLAERKFKLQYFIIIFSLLYFILAIFLVKNFSPADSYKFTIYYNWLGGDNFVDIILIWLKHPLQVVAHIFSLRNIFVIAYLFLIFLFIPLFAKKYLLISFFVVIQYIMTAGGIGGNHIYMHYVMPLLPGFFLAYIFGIWAIINSHSSIFTKIIHGHKNFFLIIFILSQVFFFIFISPVINTLMIKYPKNYQETKIIDQIPTDASMAVDHSLLPQFSLRTNIYTIDSTYHGKSPFAERDFILPPVDYIVINMNHFLATINGRNAAYYWERGDPFAMPDNWEKTLADYNLVYAQDNLYLWKNKKISDNTTLPYFEYQVTDQNGSSPIKGWSLEKVNNQNILKVSYNNLNSNYFLIRFYQQDYFWEMPFDYGLYSLARKQDGQSITIYYYLSKEVDSFELYHYQGKNILGDRGNIDFLLKRSIVFPKTILQ